MDSVGIRVSKTENIKNPASVQIRRIVEMTRIYTDVSPKTASVVA